jgi:hypothetical protein
MTMQVQPRQPAQELTGWKLSLLRAVFGDDAQVVLKGAEDIQQAADAAGVVHKEANDQSTAQVAPPSAEQVQLAPGQQADAVDENEEPFVSEMTVKEFDAHLAEQLKKLGFAPHAVGDGPVTVKSLATQFQPLTDYMKTSGEVMTALVTEFKGMSERLKELEDGAPSGAGYKAHEATDNTVQSGDPKFAAKQMKQSSNGNSPAAFSMPQFWLTGATPDDPAAGT